MALTRVDMWSLSQVSRKDPKVSLLGLIKPAVHLVQDLGQPAFGVSLGPFDRDPLLFTPAVRVFTNIDDDGPGALGTL